MPDYSDSRSGFGSAWPLDTIASVWRQLEPLLDVEQLKSRFLAGVPLYSALPDPVTRKLTRITDDGLRDIIDGAVSEVEAAAHARIMPAQIKERHAFDRVEFEAFGYFRLRQRPISSIEKLFIEGSEGTNFFTIPAAWVEVGNLHQGQINIIPLSPASANATFASLQNGGPNGLVYMTLMSRLGSIPAYWTTEYTVGFPEGKIPRLFNDAIGMQAAIQVLSMLSATFTRSSQSLGIDALSQSTSGPGPQQFTQRIKELQDDYTKKIKRIKVALGQALFSGNL